MNLRFRSPCGSRVSPPRAPTNCCGTVCATKSRRPPLHSLTVSPMSFRCPRSLLTFLRNVASARKAHEGSPYRLRVKTAHPLTAKPVSGVSVKAQLKFDGYDRDDVILLRS